MAESLNLLGMTSSLNWLEISGGLNLVLLGKIGAGKSASGNTILGRQAFESKESFTSVTQDLAVESGTVFGRRVTVYDTPGLFNTKLSEEKVLQIYENVLRRCESGRCAFLLVIKADRFTEKERRTVEKIEKLLGENRLKKTWILFTGRDELEEENKSIDEFINDTEPLKRLVQKYDQRYHVFNNKKKEHNGQVQELLTKIDAIVEGAKPKPQAKPSDLLSHLRSVTAQIVHDITFSASVASILLIKPDTSRRIVLLGQTGVGKSAAGNTILGKKVFRSVMSMRSVTSECSEAHTTVSGRSVSVVDTPGFFHTELNTDELLTEIARSVYISSPEPRAFLIVFNLSMRFTEQELQILELIKTRFRERVLKYSIFLFTHGDQLEEQTVEKLIEENCVLRHLVDQCGGRFHVFNNKDQNNREQVNDLLQKIDTMIEQNGGGHYSNRMFEDFQRFKQRQEEIERVRKETGEKIRAEFEGPPRFLLERLKSMRLKEGERKRRKEERKRRQEDDIHERMLLIFKRRINAMREREEEEQRQAEIERVIKETEEKIRAEFEGHFFFFERFRSMRLREEEEKTQREEKQRQEEIERVRKETEEKIRAEFEGPPSFLLERFRSMRLREEEEKTQREEKQRQKEIERVRKETEEKIRAEFEGPPSFLLKRLKSVRQREEDWARFLLEQEEFEFYPCMPMDFLFDRRRDMLIERVIEETEEKIRAEFKGPPG